MPNHRNQMKRTAKSMAALGRNGDSVLVHMSPGELAGLKSLAYEHGTEMTINPITGLPEAFKLKKLFKKLLVPIAGIAGSMFGLPPWVTASLVGGLTKATGGSWKQALLAGAASGLTSGAGTKLAGLGKTATDATTKAALDAGASEATKKAAVDTALKDITGETLKKTGSSILTKIPGQILPTAGKMDFLKNLGTGITTGVGSEAGRAAGLAALGGKLGAAGLGFTTLASMPKSKVKPMKTDPAKYWVGKGKPLWRPGKFNLETGEFEGQGYGTGEFTEDPAIAIRGFTTEDDSEDTLNAYSGGSIRGYADGGDVKTDLADVVTPSDAANLSGLAAINYGDPANATLNRSAEYGPAQGTYDPAAALASRQADLARDIPMQQQFVRNVPDFDLSNLTTGMSTAGRDPDMAPTPERLGAYYKNLMSGGGGQTVARSLSPLQSYMARVEQGLIPNQQATSKTVNELVGTRGGATGGGSFVRGENGALEWVPSGTTFMQATAGTADPNILALLAAFAGNTDALTGGTPGGSGQTGSTSGSGQTGSTSGSGQTGDTGGSLTGGGSGQTGSTSGSGQTGTQAPTVPPKLQSSQFWSSLNANQRELYTNYLASKDPEILKQYQASFTPEQKRLRTLYMTTQKAEGGMIRGYAGGGATYAAGGRLLRGPGDGMSDSIPAVIRGNPPQKAALGDGEFVIPADVVASLGNGSTEPGAKQLYAMMDRVRSAKYGRKKQPPSINPKKYMPA